MYHQVMVRKIPRGKGYDKAATLRHLKKMVQGGVFVTDYVKANGLKLDTFMLAAGTYDDGAHVSHRLVAGDPKLITQNCEQCAELYWPSKKGTRFCSPYCGNLWRKDQEYFGGKRSGTVGLDERVCQLCQRHVDKGLSSHHIYGKSNDPGNDFLLALCSGCHAIVSDLALKTWVDRPEVLQKLIWLAVTQRQGERWIRERSDGWGFFVEVKLLACPYRNS